MGKDNNCLKDSATEYGRLDVLKNINLNGYPLNSKMCKTAIGKWLSR